MRGTTASLVIKQGKEEQFKPTLYIYPKNNSAAYETILTKTIEKLQSSYPGITYKKTTNGFEILVPEKYKEGHESHFARVTEKYLDYLQHKNMPTWEVPNMIAKYYTTSMAREMAEKK
jgi:hypothetical protein